MEQMYKNPEMFTEWLKVQLNFKEYSATNRAYIYFQNPKARFVATYKKWKELGFPVKRSGDIKILCPVFVKGFEDENGKFKSLKHATDDEKKKVEAGIYKKKQILYDYRLISVFDISNTDATEEDLIHLLAESKKNQYPYKPEEILSGLCEYLEVESKDENPIDGIYHVVHSHIEEMVNQEEIFDEDTGNIVTEAVTYTVLSQLNIDTTLFEFKMLNNLNYESDMETLNKLNYLICTATDNVINELSCALV